MIGISDRIFATLAMGPATVPQLCRVLGAKRGCVWKGILKLKWSGQIVKLFEAPGERGAPAFVWARKERTQ